MLKYDDLRILSSACRRVIKKATFQEAQTGVKQAHSIGTIFAEERDISVAYRLPTRMVGSAYYSERKLAETIRNAVETDGYFYLPSSISSKDFAKAENLYVLTYEGDKAVALDGYVIDAIVNSATLSKEERMNYQLSYEKLGYRFYIGDDVCMFKLTKRFSPKCTHLLSARSGLDLDGALTSGFSLVI